MIIKSMSRKQPSFEQLYDYIVRDKDNDVRFNFAHNCFGMEREQILDEFYENASLLKRRKGGNYMYHDVLSVTRSKQLSEGQQKEILRDLAQQYVKSRAKDCLVFGGMHDEKDNQLHYHFIISANKVADNTRFRMTKKEFDDAKVNTELYALEMYPELEQEKLISNKNKKGEKSNKEEELKRRTRKPSQKDIMRDKLADIFKESTCQTDYIKRLREANIESYIRGNVMGFINIKTSRRHRITTLGLSEEFDEMQYVFTHKAERKADDGDTDGWQQGKHQEQSEKQEGKKGKQSHGGKEKNQQKEGDAEPDDKPKSSEQRRQEAIKKRQEWLKEERAKDREKSKNDSNDRGRNK